VLERVLHNAELCQTDFAVDRVRRKLPLFVQNAAFPRAMQLLDDTRIVVISGVPGIGKTTLAEMLLYAHLEQGYEPVVIQAEIAEAKKFFKPGAKQVFYYDDFLGQTFLGDRREYLGRNQDVAIVDFMDMVRHSDKSRFILTTREHILSSALQMSERLAHSPMLAHRCVFELRDYSYAQRARILYNHLYFSNLPQPYKVAVLEGDFFLEIIKHKHFNPRLIEWLSTYTRLREVGPDTYRAHISALLESPETIWAHAFRSQISNAARHVLLCLYTLGEWINVIDLEPAFVSLHRYCAINYNQSIAPGDFRNSLQELDGAFLSYNSGTVSYLNPSIREFVASMISEDHGIAEDLLNAAVRFRQVVNLWKLCRARPDSTLNALLTSNLELLRQSAFRVLYGPWIRWEKMRHDGSQRGIYVDTHYEHRINFLIEVAEIQQATQLSELACQAADHLIEGWNRHYVEFPLVLRLLEEIAGSTWFLAHGGRETYRRLLDGVLERVSYAHAQDWRRLLAFPEKALDWNEADRSRLDAGLKRYRERGVEDDIDGCATLEDFAELKDSLEKLTNEFGLDFARDIGRLDEEMAERGDPDDDRDTEGTGISRSAEITDEWIVTDEDVREMFSTLHDGDQR
jgi:conflict system STAND superfamily ATPase